MDKISIIGSILYNTGLVQEIGFDTNGHSPNDFPYVTETLYRNCTGEYFLCCIGREMNQCAVPASSTGNERSNIVPLTFNAAREWADELLSLSEMRDSIRAGERVPHANALQHG